MTILMTRPLYSGPLPPQLIPRELEGELLPPTRRHVQEERRSLAARPWRTEQFIQYYNQGGPSPMHPQGCPQGPDFRPCEGWAPGECNGNVTVV